MCADYSLLAGLVFVSLFDSVFVSVLVSVFVSVLLADFSPLDALEPSELEVPVEVLAVALVEAAELELAPDLEPAALSFL
jgi:hypothetical protein